MYLPRTFLESTGLKRGLPAIFVHTPKCGGSFIAEGIGRRRERHCFTRRHPLLKGHKMWTEYRDLFPRLGRDIHDYMTFSVVRNPWDWHVSFFHYIRQMTGRYREIFAEEHAELNRISFAEYLAWIDDPDRPKPGWLDEATRNVCEWVVDEAGEIAVDVMMRQEKLEADFQDFIDAYGLRLQVPKARVNTSVHKDFRTYYSDPEVEIVARRHVHDVALFGYSFDA